MTDGRPGLWAFYDDETDDGLDPHCINCGQVFEGTKRDKRCPTCQHMMDHMAEFIAEFDSEPQVDVSDAFKDEE